MQCGEASVGGKKAMPASTSVRSPRGTSFLFTMYQHVAMFMVIFVVIIFVFLGWIEGFSRKGQPCPYNEGTCKPALYIALFSTASFLLGSITTLVSGFLGMKIATYAKGRTTLEARKGVGKHLSPLSALVQLSASCCHQMVMWLFTSPSRCLRCITMMSGKDFSSSSLVMILVGLPWLYWKGLVEVSTLRLRMWVLIFLSKLKGTFLKMTQGTQL